MDKEMLEQFQLVVQGIADMENRMNQRFDGLEQRMDGLESRVSKTEIMIENTVIPQIQLLTEGQSAIREQIKRLSVIDAMQDDIATLKTAVKYLSAELESMKKAM